MCVCIWVLHQKAGYCVSSTTHMPGTIVNVHKKYSCCFIKLRLKNSCHLDYFNDVLLITFLGLEHFSFIADYGGSESSWISSKIS